MSRLKINTIVFPSACRSSLSSVNCIFKFPAVFYPSKINQNLPVYNKRNGYWVLDQGQSSGLIVSSICWNLMPFKLCEWSTSFFLDQISLIYRESFSNGMELRGWFYLFWLKMFEFLYHLLAPGTPRNGWVFTDTKNKSINMKFVGLYFLLVLQSLLSWNIFYEIR